MTSVLGCSSFIILRPVGTEGSFQIVGQGYLEGLVDGSGLLGPLPKGWSMDITFKDSGQLRRSYVNPGTGQDTMDDPRLEPLSPLWEVVGPVGTDADPDTITYVNQETGETCIGDPRLEPNSLRQHGIYVEDFKIV